MIDCSKKSKKEDDQMDVVNSHQKLPNSRKRFQWQIGDYQHQLPLINTIISIQKRILHFIRIC